MKEFNITESIILVSKLYKRQIENYKNYNNELGNEISNIITTIEAKGFLSWQLHLDYITLSNNEIKEIEEVLNEKNLFGCE